MPNLDGLQSTRLIRQSGFSAPIVALTAYAEESNVKVSFQSLSSMIIKVLTFSRNALTPAWTTSFLNLFGDPRLNTS